MPVILMSLAGIKKKKLQSFLIGTIILVSSLMLATSLGIILTMNEPFDNLHSKLKSSHVIIDLNSKRYDATKIDNWWRKQKEVESCYKTPLFQTAAYKNRKLLFYPEIIERPDNNINQDKVITISGKNEKQPLKNEAWITNGTADQLRLKVGDILKIEGYTGLKSYKISAIVIDPMENSDYSTSVLWIKSGTMGAITSQEKANYYFEMIRLKNYDTIHSVWGRFSKFLKAPFLGDSMKYENIKYFTGMMSGMISAVMLAVSIIIIVVMVFVLYFVISSSVLSECRQIGILKAMGFTPANVVSIYVMQYLLISAVSSLIGAALSIFTIDKFIKLLISSIKILDVNYPYAFIIGSSFVFVNILVCLFCIIASVKINSIKPVEAIKLGAVKKFSNNSRHFSLTKLKRLDIPFMLCIRNLLNFRFDGFLLLVITALGTLIITACINMSNTVGTLGENMQCLGLEQSDVVLYLNHIDENELKSKLRNKSLNNIIEKVGFRGDKTVGVKGLDDALEGNYYENELSFYGLTNIIGKDPETSNEVSLCLETAKKLKKHVGDYIDFYDGSKKKTYLITGLYQSILHMGLSYRMKLEGIKRLTDNTVSYVCFINLKKGVSKKTAINEISTLGIQRNDLEDSSKAFANSLNSSQYSDGISAVSIALGFMVTVVCFIIIFNICVLNIYRQKSEFAVFKAFGMTNREIRLSVIYELLLITLIGSIIGITAALGCTANIVNLFSESFGIAKFEINPNVFGTAILLPAALLFTFIAGFIACLRVLKIDTRELGMEN